MNCSLIDLACHAQGAAWEWWAGVGFLNKALIVAGLASIIIGIGWNLGTMLSRIGGWPAVIGAVAAIVGLVLALMPRRPVGELNSENVDGPDADPPPKKRPKPRKKTLQDLFSDGLR